MKRIIVCTWAIMASMVLLAQDIIVTTDAKRKEAKVLQVSKSDVMYREKDDPEGPIFLMPVSEVNSIIYSTGRVDFYNQVPTPAAKETNTPKEEPKQEPKFQPSYQGFIEASGYVTSANSITYGGVSLDLINGIRFNKYIYFGLGTGLYGLFAHPDKGISVVNLLTPLYSDFRLYIPISKNVNPFIETSIGPIFNYYQSASFQGISYSETELITMAQFRVNLGLEIRRFVFGAGYELWANRDEKDHYFYFKIGVRLGK